MYFRDGALQLTSERRGGHQSTRSTAANLSACTRPDRAVFGVQRFDSRAAFSDVADEVNFDAAS